MFLEQVGVHTKGEKKKKKDWSERLEVQMVCFLFILIESATEMSDKQA